MTAILDIMSPTYIGEKKLTVEVDPASELLTNRPITINFGYDNAIVSNFNHSVNLPLQLIVQPGFGEGGTGNGFISKTFRQSRPSSYTFSVPSSGNYLVTLREMYHNRWFGSLTISVTGDEFSRLVTSR